MPRRPNARLLAPLFAASLLAAPARGLAAPPALEHGLAGDLSFTLAAWGLVVASESFLKPALAPETCRWCSDNRLDRAMRSATLWGEPATAKTLSDIGAALVVPALSLGLVAFEGLRTDAPEPMIDVLTVAESAAAAALLTQLFKLAFARERPFVHALADTDKGRTARPYDNNVSFFSGHTSIAFAFATSAGTVATMRGYRLAPLIWTLGCAAAAMTGYLRMAADRHWFTDVLVGAGAGVAAGVLVPRLLHPPREGKETARGLRVSLPVIMVVF